MIDISTLMRGCVSGELVTLAWFAQKVLLHILSPTVVHGTGLNQIIVSSTKILKMFCEVYDTDSLV